MLPTISQCCPLHVTVTFTQTSYSRFNFNDDCKIALFEWGPEIHCLLYVRNNVHKVMQKSYKETRLKSYSNEQLFYLEIKKDSK